jgi:DNA processing protein
LAKGCHALIKQGALLVETADDILQHLGWIAQAQQEVDANATTSPQSMDLTPEFASILHEIDFSPTPLDVLVERCKKSVADLSPILLTLELEGWIIQAAGGYQRQK